MPRLDATFQKLFSKIFVYNILFEDSEVDERYLGVGPDSRILGISGAGCGIANHLSRHPVSIDTVDINRHHLALTALKVGAAQTLQSYGEFYSLVGSGRNPEGTNAILKAVQDLPAWIQEYWRRNANLFSKNMYRHGLTARLLGLLRMLSGVNENWVKDRVGESVDDRKAAIQRDIVSVLDNPMVRALVNSPIQLLALGINYEQRRKIEEANNVSFREFIQKFFLDLAGGDLERNWFVWWALTGQFNHANAEGVPPYLRAERHASSIQSPTTVRFHNENIFKVLGQAGPGTWTHYTLCDAVDWMPNAVQRRLFDEIFRTSRDGGVVLMRSVENDDLMAQHGLGHRFRLMEDETRAASIEDRTRQYRQVALYQVCK